MAAIVLLTGVVLFSDNVTFSRVPLVYRSCSLFICFSLLSVLFTFCYVSAAFMLNNF